MAAETIQSLLSKSIAFLDEKGASEARRSAELLLASALSCSRMDLYLHFERPLSEEELARYRVLIKRRLAGEPVQYILGETEFYGLRLKVTPGVLIPRPETEHLVERAISVARERFPESPVRMLDIGAGSGAIAVALCANLRGATVTAVDVSKEALEVAEANARAHGVSDRLTLLEWDVLDDNAAPIDGPFHIVVSNPPYIPEADAQELQVEIRAWEPRIAYTDGADGLTFYRRIARIAPRLLCDGGRVLVEIGFGQATAVTEIFGDQGLTVETIDRDYSGIERVVCAG